jgi:carbon monoxide dehydrogenase subunit G
MIPVLVLRPQGADGDQRLRLAGRVPACPLEPLLTAWTAQILLTWALEMVLSRRPTDLPGRERHIVPTPVDRGTMQLNGTYTFRAPRQAVWNAMLSAAAIQECMPGCEEFKTVAADQYQARMRVGVGSIKGTFQGKIRIVEQAEPESYRMEVEGGGGPGRVKGSGVLTLQAAGDQTVVSYDGEAQVAGLIASVGQRLLAVTARKLIEQFFKCMERQVAS